MSVVTFFRPKPLKNRIAAALKHRSIFLNLKQTIHKDKPNDGSASLHHTALYLSVDRMQKASSAL